MREVTFNVPINNVSFGQVSTSLLREAYKREMSPLLFPIGGGIDLASHAEDHRFSKWIQEAHSRCIKSHSRDNKTIKLYNQNYNDLYKSLEWLKEEKIKKIDIIGIDGKRPDHMIGNFDIIFKKLNDFDINIFTDYGIFHTAYKKQVFNNCLNKNISIFSPILKNKITTTGLKYELENKQLNHLYEGTLNKAIKNKITIESKEKIFVFISK